MFEEFIQEQSFNNFEKNTMKLPVEEAKLACAPGSVLLFNWFGF